MINAVGILRERGGQRFDAIHARAPCALFQACEAAGVALVLQISALGADAGARSRYHLSKKRADDVLLALPLRGVVAQPALVYGDDGVSARRFTGIASWPLLPRLGRAEHTIQPLHVDDLVAAVMALLAEPPARSGRVELAGPEPLSLTDFLQTLRAAMGLPRGRVLTIPRPLVRLGAAFGALLPNSLLDGETLAMLERGNSGSPATLRHLLGYPARPPAQFIAPAAAPRVRLQAKLSWLLPLLRASLAALWLGTAAVSLGLYPVADSYALLARTGLSGTPASVALYGAALLDLALGLGTLLMRRRRRLWQAQIALIVAYSAIIAWKLPEFWLHPYGPLLKNLPLLAALCLLLELDESH
ncbi:MULTISPECIES: SDR family oxidoreductase [unclassified Janthinobacterium]|uniref:SDR family oxidoreductase n=1 Tax=unclassified Janthinobacterium TaxID=2610881 RepID=UPI00034A884D|nr:MULTISPECIES: SDR family oxidoreductase [unclassified Janthinobacterium]MEC5159021.1 uncharacterized protein YbjT (DUF2867 family) [Janthinobacterium sp. CG_S6]